jgi:hypothetical protein
MSSTFGGFMLVVFHNSAVYASPTTSATGVAGLTTTKRAWKTTGPCPLAAPSGF